MSSGWSGEQNRERVFNWLKRRFDSLTSEEALDRALQEVEQRIAGYQSEQHFVNAWKQRAARRAVDILRRRRRRPPPRPQPPAASWLSRVRMIVGELNERQRQVIVCYHMDGEVDQEIGERLWPHLSPAAQNSRAFRLRRRAEGRLRDRFIEEGLDPITLDFNLGPFGNLRRFPRDSMMNGAT